MSRYVQVLGNAEAYVAAYRVEDVWKFILWSRDKQMLGVYGTSADARRAAEARSEQGSRTN
jgi:hypothetical protein